MKAANLIAIVLGTALYASLCACGGHGYGTMSMPSQPMQPPQSQTMMLNVSDVLTKAKSRSETEDPFVVNGGAVTVNPSSDDESDPVSID